MATSLLLLLPLLAQAISPLGQASRAPTAGPPSVLPAIDNLHLATRGTVCVAQRDDDSIGGRWIALGVLEAGQGMTDLNGDGDAQDLVLFVHDTALGTTTSVGKAMVRCNPPFVHGAAVGLVISEASQGNTDLNGDGDDDDAVVHFYDIKTGSLQNQRAVVPNHGTIDRFSLHPGGTVIVEMSEEGVVPLNADGDLVDSVLDAWFLGPKSGVRPVQPALVRRNAGPLLASASSTVGTSSYYATDGSFLVVGVDEIHEGHRDLNGDGDATDPDVLFLTDLGSGEQRNLGLVGNLVQLSPGAIAFRASELFEGADLNGDGDQDDQVLHVYEPAKQSLTNLGLAIGVHLRWIDDHLIALVSESDQGQLDLNGDGDAADEVAIVLAPGTWSITNIGVPSFLIAGSTKKAFFTVSESGHGADLNGDGDLGDLVLHAWDVAGKRLINLRTATVGAPLSGQRFIHFYALEIGQGADLNFDGDLDDSVLAAYDSRNDTFHNTATAVLQVPITAPRVNESEDGFFLLVFEYYQGGKDLNGDGDNLDFVLQFWRSPGPYATNLGVSVSNDQALTVGGSTALFEIQESSQSQDLNGDGDLSDTVAHILRLP